MRTVNTIITTYNTAKKQAEQAEKQAAAEAAAKERAAQKAKERAQRERAIKKFPKMTGIILITKGHHTWGPNDSSKHSTTIAVTLYNGNVTAATPIAHYASGHRRGDRAYGDCTDSSYEYTYAAPHTPKAAAVYERCTRDSGDYERHCYTIGKSWVRYEDMKDKVEEILAHPIAIAAIALAAEKAV